MWAEPVSIPMTSNTSSRFIALVSLFAALFVLALGMPSAYAQSGSIVLRVGGSGNFKLPDKNDTAPDQRANRAIVEAFERLHPNIRLVSAQGLQLQGPAAESNLLLQFAGGTGPDVVYVNFRSSATYISQGFLMPLDSYIQQDPSVLNNVGPVVRNVLRDVGNGHIYSLPYAQYVQALYYRKDLFREAGLDPNKPPTNWDQFYYDCTQLTDHSKGIWGFEFGNDPDAAAYWWINFLWQAGGEIIKKNSAGQWQAAFNTPQGVTALEFYKKLMLAPYKERDGKTYDGVARLSSTLWDDRPQGKVAMWFAYQSNVIANTADATTINPSLVGIAPMPHGPTGITANEINAAMWGISSQIKDPRVREAAWEFVKFMGSDEADRIRTKAFVEAGLGSTVNPLSLEKYGYEDYETPQSKAWLAANKTLFLHGKPEPYAQNMNEIYILLGIPLDQIRNNPNANPMALLNAAAANVNNKLTGYVDPKVMHERRVWAWIIFALILLVGGGFLARNFATVMKQLYASFSGSTPSTAGTRTKPITHILAWIFMVPAVLSILVWSYAPLARGLVIAFQDYQIIKPAHWVGLDNFIEAFNSASFWNGLEVALLFTVYSLGFGFFLPIFLALGLSEIPKGKMLYRTLYYLPAVTSSLIITFLWKSFYDNTQTGLFNHLLDVGTHGHITSIAQHMNFAYPVDWLGNTHLALLSVVVPAIWGAAGPGCIVYLAALKGVDEEMYEAADLDGAGVWTKIWRVTMPTLKPLILINLVGATIAAFKASEQILIMTGGGPANATNTIGLEVFYNAFLYLRFGYATAVAWIMGAMLIGFTLWQLRMLKDLRFSTARA